MRAGYQSVSESGDFDAGTVKAVSRSSKHGFSKDNQNGIRLLAGLGVEGDVHASAAVQHRSRVAKDPTQPNLRQVHLIHAELFDELAAVGFQVTPGQIGENVTTQGIDLLSLPVKTRLHIGAAAIVEITGLRNPCQQLNQFQPGLMPALIDRDPQGGLIRKAGIMGIVIASGTVIPGDRIRVSLPPEPHQPLAPV
ncbi:MAG: MOSC domain-containing protein [Cyanobacteria bacterium P01_C01_bin.120]